jgi:hypothetical protein
MENLPIGLQGGQSKVDTPSFRLYYRRELIKPDVR